jgi:putative ABC transport system permease protein
MHSVWQDFRYAMRTLRNAPGFTLVAIITLGLAMAVNTTIFSVINGILLRPMPVPQPEQIAVLAMQQTGMPGFQRFSYPDFQDLSRQASSFSDIIGYRPTLVGLAVDGKAEHCVLSRVTGNYFFGSGPATRRRAADFAHRGTSARGGSGSCSRIRLLAEALCRRQGHRWKASRH